MKTQFRFSVTFREAECSTTADGAEGLLGASVHWEHTEEVGKALRRSIREIDADDLEQHGKVWIDTRTGDQFRIVTSLVDPAAPGEAQVKAFCVRGGMTVYLQPLEAVEPVKVIGARALGGGKREAPAWSMSASSREIAAREDRLRHPSLPLGMSATGECRASRTPRGVARRADLLASMDRPMVVAPGRAVAQGFSLHDTTADDERQRRLAANRVLQKAGLRPRPW